MNLTTILTSLIEHPILSSVSKHSEILKLLSSITIATTMGVASKKALARYKRKLIWEAVKFKITSRFKKKRSGNSDRNLLLVLLLVLGFVLLALLFGVIEALLVLLLVVLILFLLKII